MPSIHHISLHTAQSQEEFLIPFADNAMTVCDVFRSLCCGFFVWTIMPRGNHRTATWRFSIATASSNLDWLAVWNINFIFPYIGNNHPNWRSYFWEGWPNHQPVEDVQGCCLVAPLYIFLCFWHPWRMKIVHCYLLAPFGISHGRKKIPENTHCEFTIIASVDCQSTLLLLKPQCTTPSIVKFI